MLPLIVANILVLFINAITVGYLASRDGDPTLRSWTVAWSVSIISTATSAVADPVNPGLFAAIVFGSAVSLSGLAFLDGAYRLSGRSLPSAWRWATALAAVSAVVLALTVGLAAALTPLAIMLSAGTVSTAIVVYRAEPGRVGAQVFSAAMTGLGVQVFVYPAVMAHPRLLAFAYVVTGTLQILTAVGMVMLYYEIATDRWRASEHALSDARCTEALGRIASGVAHDFNNLLMVVQGNLDLMDPARVESVEESAGEIQQAVAQAVRLTAQLLAFGRRSVLQPEMVDLREVIERTFELFTRVSPAHVELSFSAEPGDYRTSIDRVLVEQIVLNLVSNGVDAVGERGRIGVTLEHLDVPFAGFRIQVHDDGAGMKTEVLDHIFEPFFTTKPSGEGTGLGLASVHGAVGQLGGQIAVRSEPGEGTTFEVLLPERRPAVGGSITRPVRALHEAVRIRVLVVDDDDMVREVATRLLERAGHVVVAAADGVEALRIAGQQPLDVVLSDVIMPGMKGTELAARLAVAHPQVSVVLMSGCPADETLDAGDARFIAKPFSGADLIETVEAAGRRHSASG
ncbi:MAG: signal transduction histidine kinase/CheY-like chemotaxis protein [Myxococcota bacterium]|jgi:signal transduction histidine kinase/CheY-like chemotaxis protein